MPHPLRTSVDDLIEGLKSFERHLITQDEVKRFMEEVPIKMDAIRPFVFWRDSFYTRNLIYRDDMFEVMAICWMPGQKTAIHSHNGQLGWMSVPEGEVVVNNFKYVRCSNPERQNVVGIDCLAGGHHIELERVGNQHCTSDEMIVTVDKLQTIHQIENPGTTGCVSLHVYSKPIDSCVAYDLEKDVCFRRNLTYFSKYGVVEAEGPLPQPEIVNS
ncbi:MAG TPA: cysteine dioxygenase family protein [Terriglobales bacterium]